MGGGSIVSGVTARCTCHEPAKQAGQQTAPSPWSHDLAGLACQSLDPCSPRFLWLLLLLLLPEPPPLNSLAASTPRRQLRPFTAAWLCSALEGGGGTEGTVLKDGGLRVHPTRVSTSDPIDQKRYLWSRRPSSDLQTDVQLLVSSDVLTLTSRLQAAFAYFQCVCSLPVATERGVGGGAPSEAPL